MSPEQLRRARELYAEGHALDEVARVVGFYRKGLARAFKEAGIEIRGNGGRRSRRRPAPPPHPVPVSAPREPLPAADLADTAKLSVSEMKLVDWCVEALRVFESDMTDRLRKLSRLERTRYRNQYSSWRHFDSPDDILTRAGIPWRRQVTLMSIAVARAKESGLYLAYNTLSPLRRQVEREREESA